MRTAQLFASLSICCLCGVFSSTRAALGAPVHHWAFDGDLSDSAGTNDGTAQGNAAIVAGSRLGTGALALDGSGDFVLTSQTAGQAPIVTYAGWVNLSQSRQQTLLGRVIESPQTPGGFNFNITSSGQLQLYVQASGGNEFFRQTTNASVVSNSAWHHVAVTYSNVANFFGGATFYIDGAPITGTSVSGGNQVSGTGSANSEYRIGARRDGTGTVAGLLDDVAVWHELLAPVEIRALHSLASELALAYDVSEVQALFDLHDAGTGSVVIDGREWQFTDGLSSTQGEVAAIPGGFAIRLGDTTGVQAVVPEPQPACVAALALAGLVWRRRRSSAVGSHARASLPLL